MRRFNLLKLSKNQDFLILPPVIKIAIFGFYCIFFGLTVISGVYLITYFLLILAFLFIASIIGGYEIIRKLNSLSRTQKAILIFSVALLLRLLMLYQTQVIGVDLERYVKRSSFMLEGQLPYRDFYGGNKPPLYEFMLFLMGGILTPGALQFRMVFSIFDALIPVALFYICINRYDGRFGLASAMTYALFPVSIITVGLSGHYDSVVVLFSLVSILFLFRNRPNISGLSLGVAFALKIFPAVLLPFFLSTLKTWKARILYVILFALPTLIADGVLYLISPQAFSAYLSEESEWFGYTSFAHTLELILNTSEILSINISWFVLGIFGLLILLLLKDWLSPKRNEHLIRWFKIVIFIFIIYYGFYIVYGFLYYNKPVIFALIAVIIYFCVMALVVHRFLPRIVPKKLVEPKAEGLIVVSTFAIILFMFGLPNIAPWYFIWFFPFLLAIRNNKIRYSLLWIFPWHGIGENMSLLPGMKPIN